MVSIVIGPMGPGSVTHIFIILLVLWSWARVLAVCVMEEVRNLMCYQTFSKIHWVVRGSGDPQTGGNRGNRWVV
jgi:hypothetical protein